MAINPWVSHHQKQSPAALLSRCEISPSPSQLAPVRHLPRQLPVQGRSLDLSQTACPGTGIDSTYVLADRVHTSRHDHHAYMQDGLLLSGWPRDGRNILGVSTTSSTASIAQLTVVVLHAISRLKSLRVEADTLCPAAYPARIAARFMVSPTN